MTIVRSLGVSTLVALMSAHRAAAEGCDAARKPFDQAMIDSIDAYLRLGTEDAASHRQCSAQPPPSND
jgi:hypothetical protein